MLMQPPAAVAQFLAASPLSNFIDGQWSASAGGQTHPVRNPADGTTIAHVPASGSHEIDLAVKAAHKAFHGWSTLPPAERAVLLHRWADAMDRRAAELAAIESLDVGKAINAAEGFDIPFGIQCIRYFADMAAGAQYDRPLAIKNMDARVHRRPYGVCGFIFPWNFPFDLLMWGIAPALAAGNTVVVKPSEVTPLSTLFVCRLAEDAGIPRGVLNVVTGTGPEAGEALTNHPLIRRMSFTGSPSVGKRVAEACGRRLIPCKLELGGKGAAVVFGDVDPVATGKSLADAITLNTGQVCCTATRWILHESVRDAVINSAIQQLKATRIGPGLDRETQMGPLASAEHHDRVLGHLQRGVEGGAKYLLKGGRANIAGFEGGYFVEPSLLEGDAENVCYREEVFGPTAFVTAFRDAEQAITLVNGLQYGLANSVWTRDLGRAAEVAERLVAGNCWVNAHNVFAYGLPYGGVNLSGFGGGVNSPETFNDYLRPQTIARPL